MSNIAAFEKLPEISFIDNLTQEQVLEQLKSDYIAAYEEVAGTAPTLAAASTELLLLKSFAAQYYQALCYIDRAGKQGLLKYSEGDCLDNLGLLRGVSRRAATPACCTLRFTLSDIRGSATGIPGGTRVAAGSIYFATDEYLEIAAGSQTGEVLAHATAAGVAANGLPPGAVNVLVDTLPYVARVENTVESFGGAEVEGDDSLTERIWGIGASYSVAGPQDAYIYHARAALANIDDVRVMSPAVNEVAVYFTMNGGELPSEEEIAAVEAYLADENVRPMNDRVTVSAPEPTEYTVNLEYYINRSERGDAAAISARVEAAVEEYELWQKKIGRDINPAKLVELVMQAGAKRVKVTAPTFAAVNAYNIGVCVNKTVIYAGLEDD